MTKTFRKNTRLINKIDITDFHNESNIHIEHFGGIREIALKYSKNENTFYLIQFFKEKGRSKGKTGKYKGIKYLYQILEYFCSLKNIDINSTNLELASDYLRKLSKEDFEKSHDNNRKHGKHLFNYKWLSYDYEKENDYNFETKSYGIIDYYHRLGLKNKIEGYKMTGPRGEIITRFLLHCNLKELMNNIRIIHKLEPINY